jgi:acyl dehydratase
MWSYPEILAVQCAEQTVDWTETDHILYALAIGFGSTPGQQESLRYVYEKSLQTVPAVCSTIARRFHPDFSAMGVDFGRVVLLNQRTEFHNSTSIPQSIRAQPRIHELYDLGASRGAVIMVETVLRDAHDDSKIATVTAGLLARADGGMGGNAYERPARHSIPERRADDTVEYLVPYNQGLLYRLLGDRNPLHVDPVSARQQDYSGPILHGLSTYGMMCRAILERVVDYDGARMKSLEMRFTSPVFPGDLIAIDIWKDDRTVSFVARNVTRDAKVVDNGRSDLT